MESARVVGIGLLLLSAASFLSPAIANEGDSEKSILINVDQLKSTLRDNTLRIIDVRSQDAYEEGHIPGAVRVDVAAWKNLAAGENGFHNVDGWSKALGQLGLRNKTRVAVYGSKLSDTARIWWLLKYVGVKEVSILDGGWEWWTAGSLPVEKSTTEISPTQFSPDFQTDRLAEFDSLKESLDKAQTKVVDTRSDREFNAGRIPGATHLEWSELIADDGRFKSKTELRSLFRDRGILPTETAVCY